MVNRLTEIERTMLNTLLLARDCMAGTARVSAADYTEAMAAIRDGIVLLENKERGCAWGLHAATCTCTADKKGQSFDYKKYGRR